eukprot:TRINITY_DN19012_c0_g1_i1.p1 TRINITY_DN19012_c0_g1~~TRINITY_DN19012_c0_g1_i1.p1  ORF type:complete len:980 (+),score=364.96 TRINITY_DN19012_c0_g1_i1:68-3007(+)
MPKSRTVHTDLSRWPAGLALDSDSTARLVDEYSIVVTGSALSVWHVGDRQHLYRHTLEAECEAELCTVLPSAALLAVTPRGEALHWSRLGDAHCDKAVLSLEPNEHAVYTVPAAGGALVGTDLGNLYHGVTWGVARRAGRLARGEAGGGVLSGLGRLLFRRSERPQPVLRIAASGAAARDIYVLRSESLQKWRASQDDVKFVGEAALLDSVRTSLEADEGLALVVFLLDVGVSRSGDTAYVLAASASAVAKPGTERLLSYHLVQVSDLKPVQISSLKHQPEFQEDDASLLSAKLVLAEPEAYVVWPSLVLSTKVPEDTRPLDLLDLASRDAIIGSGCLRNRAVVLSLERGVWSIHQTDVAAQQMMHSSDQLSPSDTLSVAFSAFVRGHVENELVLPFGGLSSHDLSRVVVDFSRAILDKRPSSDARWAEQDLGEGFSLHTQQQLDAKLRTLQLFADFLAHAFAGPGGHTLFASLTDEARQTIELHHQKLQAALRLCLLQSSKEFAEESERVSGPKALLIDAMRACVETVRGHPDWHWAVTATDAFYSEVSRIEELLLPLGQLVRNVTQATVFAQLTASCQAMLSIVECRNVGMLCTPYESGSAERIAPVTVVEEHLRWAFDVLVESRPPPGTEADTLYETLQQLADVVLYVYALAEPQESSVESMFAVFRAVAVDFFVTSGREMLALELADQHRHFTALATLCLQNKRLEDVFLAKYHDEFPKHLFAQYLAQGLSAELLGDVGERYPAELDQFLLEVPQFRWIHRFRAHNPIDERVYFSEAQQLLSLAMGEKASLSRRKTLLSLGRLAALCAESQGAHGAALDEIFSQRLFAVRTQQRAGLETPLDDDQTLFDRLLAPPTSAERIMHAISLAARCFASPALETSLIHAWKTLLEHTAVWDSMARDVELQRPGFNLDDAMTQTLFYRKAIEGAAQGFLDVDILSAALKAAAEKHDDKTKRVFETMFQMLKKDMTKMKMEA